MKFVVHQINTNVYEVKTTVPGRSTIGITLSEPYILGPSTRLVSERLITFYWILSPDDK